MSLLIVDVLSSLVTWCLVIVGWLVVSDQGEARDAAKDVQRRLQALRGSLLEIEQLAVKHHTDRFSEHLVHELLRQLGDFSNELSQLQRRKHVGLGMLQNVIDLRNSITGTNMDESSYQKQELTSQIVSKIANARAVLDRELLAYSYNALSSRATLRESIGRILKTRIL